MATPGSTTDQGVIARVVAAARFALTGQLPGWFGPGVPLQPQAPESVRGRALDFPVGININFRPRGGEPVNFERLKKLASNPIVSMLLQRQKDLVCGVEWRIKPRTVVDPHATEDPYIATLTDFFHEPDGEHDWGQWISALLDQLMVLDAVSIYVRPNRGGSVYGCELLDGATIKPLLNELGRRPLPPEPAYQQVLKGLPAEDYTSDELIYFPQTYRVDRVYGYSRVEQAIDIIEQSIARLRSQLGHWTHGNVGEGYFEAPDGWTPDDVATLEIKWNQMMAGSIEGRSSSPFVPHGTVFHETKTNLLADTYDEWLIRLLCFPFGVAPQPFMKQTGMGHGSAGTEKEAAEEGGIAPLLQFVTRLMNRIIRKHFMRPDLEFTWVVDSEFDPVTQSKIQDEKLKNGTLSINEARDQDGKPPVDGGEKPMIYLPTGPVLLEEASLPAAEKAALVPPPAPSPEPAAQAGKEPAAVEKDPLQKMDAKAEKRLAKAIGAYLKDKADEIAGAITGSLGKAAMDDQSGKIESALDNVDWVWGDLPAIVEPIIAGVAVAAGTDALSELNLFDSAMLKRMTARATGYANERAAELVGMKWVDGELIENPDAAWSIAETTRTLLRRTVTDAMENGSSNDQLAANIREAAAFGQDRSEMIARTETATADVQGTIAGWKESGVVAGKQWLVGDGCCDLCAALDGEVVGLDEDFGEGDPPLHPNCECTILAVLPEDMPDDDADAEVEKAHRPLRKAAALAPAVERPIEVHVHIPAAERQGGVEKTIVTKHDQHGRILEFIKVREDQPSQPEEK
jgi:SPP1 gp7 family putative phage head morphogenesis protein